MSIIPPTLNLSVYGLFCQDETFWNTLRYVICSKITRHKSVAFKISDWTVQRFQFISRLIGGFF